MGSKVPSGKAHNVIATPIASTTFVITAISIGCVIFLLALKKEDSTWFKAKNIIDAPLTYWYMTAKGKTLSFTCIIVNKGLANPITNELTTTPKIKLTQKDNEYTLFNNSLFPLPFNWVINIKEEVEKTEKETIKILDIWFAWLTALEAIGIPASINWFI